MVFLYVAPPNQISERYSKPINAWIYPLFEQNWQLFAPDPESVNWQISARGESAGPDGVPRVSKWFDLTAVDDAEVKHNVFPSHTAQNMLRRAWTSYLESHGNDDRSYSARALMFQQYLRNIAVERLAAHWNGPFQGIQLRVTMLPVAGPARSQEQVQATQSRAEIRYLPWWEASTHAR
jgi:hypothetical protein